MKKDMDQLFKQAADLYEAGYSVREISFKLNISEVKSRRFLITLGLWSSLSSLQIGRLYGQGKSVREIAEELSISVKNVQAYLPYSKGVYGRETYDAVMSRNYRERQQKTADSMRTMLEQAKGVERNGNMNFFERKLLEGEESLYAPKVMKLKLSLDQAHLDQEEMDILKTYGHVEEGITRTVLVPSVMSLHALHFLINQAFGWRNSHLHHFLLPEDIRQGLTDGGRLEEWSRLCGVYFRFPDEYEDLFWDDDYREGESPKTWMRRKYSGPYYKGAASEEYANCQRAVRNLKERYSEFEVREEFSEMLKRQQKTGEKDGSRSKGRKKFEEATTRELETTISFEIGFFELLENIQLYRIMRPTAGHRDRNDARAAVELAERFARPLPVTDRLKYEYDYGDGWEVSIECVDEFFQQSSGDGETACYVDSLGKPADKNEVLQRVYGKMKPVCIEADGLPVMDDAGGIHGYVEKLRIMKEPADPEDPEALEEQKEYRAWARMQGWTGKKVKTENIL